MKYAEKECHDCFGVFPGNEIRRYGLSKVSGTSRSQISGSDRERTRTNVKHFDVLLCPECYQKRKTGDLIKSILLYSFIAIVVFALFALSSKSSNRRAAASSDGPQAAASPSPTLPAVGDRASVKNEVVGEKLFDAGDELSPSIPPSPSTQIAEASASDSEEYADDCLIVIRGEQKGGTKCQADSNGQSTFYLFNEAGYVQYYPDDPGRQIWSAFWYPKRGADEELGSLQTVGKCLKNEIATIC